MIYDDNEVNGMNVPVYPEDFDEFIRNKRISDEEIQKKINNEIKMMLQFMKENGATNYSKAFEDVLIIIDHIQEDDQDYYEISVAKQHSRAIVK